MFPGELSNKNLLFNTCQGKQLLLAANFDLPHHKKVYLVIAACAGLVGDNLKKLKIEILPTYELDTPC